MTITGRVVYLDLEGGFWGILGDDGQKYYPVHALPDAFRHDGCRIEADVEPAHVMSMTMWGTNVRVTRIKSL